MLFSLSVITAKGVTSEPVPLVVGIATNFAFPPSLGYLKVRLRISKNFVSSRRMKLLGVHRITTYLWQHPLRNHHQER